MDASAIKHEDMLEVNIIEGEPTENGYNASDDGSNDNTNQGLKLRNLKDITSRSNSVSSTDPNLVSVATGINISMEDWPGECEFKIDSKTLCMQSEIKEKASDATYSTLLDKLYCDMNKCFSIRFVLGNPTYSYDSLSVRAMVVYIDPGYIAKAVIRCPNHMSPTDPANQQVNNPGQYEHVIWAHENAYAIYDKNQTSGRVSVATPFGIPHMGSAFVAHVYKFTCIGSCVGGINRRATAVVFSLEHQDKVIGRQILSCRICSCPKRDKKSQENAFMKNSIEQSPNSIHHVQPPQKKPKMMMYQHSSGAVIAPPVIEQMKLPIPTAMESTNGSTGMYMVPVRDYENFLAVSKFAEYLDSVSGALQDTEYRMKRAKIMMKHNMRQKELEQQDDDDDDDDHLVIDGVENY